MSVSPRLLSALLAAALLAAAGRAPAAGSTAALGTARQLAAQKQYERALAVLRAAEAAEPGNADLVIAEARVLGWKGDYAGARARLDTLGPRAAASPDALLLRASLAYYQGDLDRANALYSGVLARDPAYDAARDGLRRVRAAQAARQKALKGQWIVSAGASTSRFRNPARHPWHRQDLIVTRKLPGTQSFVHLGLHRYNRFSIVDHEYDLGLATPLTPLWRLTARAGTSPEADYRPRYSARVGLERRIGARPWVARVDLARDIYRTVATTTARLGLEAQVASGWTLRGHLIAVRPGPGAALAYGRDIALSGHLRGRLHLMAGYANAPDTENGVTVNTRSFNVGVLYDLSERTDLRLVYAHEERPNTYARREVNAVLTIRF